MASQKATVSKVEIVQIERNRHAIRLVEFYYLDSIISIGFRVNSKRGISPSVVSKAKRKWMPLA